MKHLRLYGILALVIVAAAGGFVWWAKPGEAAVAEGGYETKAIDMGAIRRIVSATGSVRPVITVEIGSQLSGQISEVLVDFNDRVKVGDLLARLDPQTFATRVAQARADLAVARAGVSNQKANVEKAAATLARAERDHKRTKELAARGNSSAAALDLALNTLEIARADLTIAKAQVDNAVALVEQRQALLEQAEIDLERTDIRSSIDGIVIDRTVAVGQTVAASLSAPILFNLAQDLSTIQIEASIDEADIGGVKAGNTVNFTVDAYPDRQFTGEVRQVRLAATELANVVTYTAVITAANPGERLLPGMTASVEIITGERQDILRISNEALRFRPPQEVLDTVQQQARGQQRGRGGPGGGGGNPVAALIERLNLSQEQQNALQEELAPARAALRAAFQGGGAGVDRQALFAQFRTRLDKALADILTPEQLAQYRASQNTEQRGAVVWTLDEAGALTPKPVTLGISDGRFTEVVRGAEEGDAIITRQARAAS